MLLQSFLSDLYFLKHCHCQSPSSRGRRQAANEQLAVNYPLPNHLHLNFRHRKNRHPSHLQGEGEDRTEAGDSTQQSTTETKSPPAWKQSSLKSLIHLSKIQRSRVPMCCWGAQFASCTLGGLHGASHSWDQQVTQQMFQGSKHKSEA